MTKQSKEVPATKFHKTYAIDVIDAMLASHYKRILIIFCQVLQHGRHPLFYSGLWGRRAYILYLTREIRQFIMAIFVSYARIGNCMVSSAI